MRRTTLRLLVAVALLLLMLDRTTLQVVHAATILVNSSADTIADDGQCTLREAIIAVNTSTASGATANECIAGSGSDVIGFAIGSGAQTIHLAGALGELPVIAKPVTIAGDTQPGFVDTPLITLDAGANSRIFDIQNTGTATLQYLVIQNGNAASGPNVGFGGGVYAALKAGAMLLIDHCVIRNNTSPTGAGDGGGVYSELSASQGVKIKNSTLANNTAQYGAGVYNNDVRLDIINSLLTQNSATADGGAVYVSGSNFSATNIINSTVENNSATTSGGGLFLGFRGTLNITASTITNNLASDAGGVMVEAGMGLNVQNSIFAYNRAGSTSNTNISGEANSLGYNLFDNLSGATVTGITTGNINPPVDPLLGVLQNNGGATFTRALQTGSPALDKIPAAGGCNSANTLTDQRGSVRPAGGLCDIGAFEGQAPAPTSTPTSSLTASVTPSATRTSTPTLTPSATTTNTITPSATLTASLTSTRTPSVTPTATYTPSATNTNTLTPSATNSSTWTPSVTNTSTVTSSATLTATHTRSATPSPTLTVSRTNTPTATSSVTLTPTASLTNTPTISPSPTLTLSRPDTIGVYMGGAFYLRNQNSAGWPDITIPFGSPGNLPVVGDWDGDGVDTIGVYISELGVFLLRDSNSPGYPDYAFVMGNPGDEPLAGKWDASMRGSGAGVYRPSNGLLFAKRALVNGFADYTMVLGNPGDHGIAGDWDGNGFDSMGVFRPANTRFYLANGIGGTTTQPAIIFSDYDFVFGPPEAIPLAGDWTGAGPSRVGYIVSGAFYLKNTMSSGTPDVAFAYGSPGMWPVAGKWTKGSVPAPPIIIVPTVEPSPTAEINDNPGRMD